MHTMDRINPNNDQSSTIEKTQSVPLLDNDKQSIDTKIKKAPDPQVKPKRSYSARRSFTVTYKQSILKNYEACATTQERGKMLRREGLYHSQICTWKSQRAAGKFGAIKKGKHSKHAVRVDHLSQENSQLKKKLAQAEAIIELQKKISDLFGTHGFSHEESEVNS